ncbi:hypothetical protein ACEWY4_005062 [Coilia grayii]|uniref:Fibronectin type-III domain-containing protein n=1 Tax=Coilia grayii TaxID=363190 RepID=A0ABD1KHN4_9TELE
MFGVYPLHHTGLLPQDQTSSAMFGVYPLHHTGLLPQDQTSSAMFGVYPLHHTAPDGLVAPRLSAVTPSSLQVSWSAPERPNAPGPLRYRLQMRTADSQDIQQLVDSVETSFDYTVEDLRPYTEYQFRLLVSHDYGEMETPWVPLVTAQDRRTLVFPSAGQDLLRAGKGPPKYSKCPEITAVAAGRRGPWPAVIAPRSAPAPREQ